MGYSMYFFHPRITMSHHYILDFPFHIVFRDRLLFHDLVRKCLQVAGEGIPSCQVEWACAMCALQEEVGGKGIEEK